MSDDDKIILGLDGNFEEAALADLMEIDVSEFAEYRAGPLPKGIFTFQIEEIGTGTFDTDDGKRGRYEVKTKVVNVLSTVQTLSDEDKANCLNRQNTINIPIFDPQKAIGSLKAFLVDIGLQGQGKMRELCDQAIGMYFDAKITHQKDRNDEDKVYANIDLSSIKPAKM